MPLLLAAIALAITVTAAPDLTEDESLRGIDGIMVIVERLHEDANATGLDRETLDAVVRDGLQKAGVRIYSADERMADDRRPYLYVNCNVMRAGGSTDMVAFSLDIEVHQRVTLAGGEYAQGLTWAKSYLGIQSADRAAQQIRHVLAGYITQFTEAHTTANDD